MKLVERIAATRPAPGELAVFYLAQAGFYFKTASGKTVCVDPYLGGCCERLFHFKRMVPAPLAIRDFQTDLLVATHSHCDHLDPDLLDCLKRRQGTRFIGSPDCRPVYEAAGLPGERVTLLAAGESTLLDGIRIRAVYADHGELAPDAVGFLLTLDGITVYDTGDTGYCPDHIMASLGDVAIDILIVPINPAYGNPGHVNAVSLAAQLRPRVVIGSHFGMFIEHGGDPGAFLEYAKGTLPKAVTPLVLAPGERMLFDKQAGVVSLETQNAF